ncbi:MAG: peptidase [Culturomica sp.]|jgi:hypothetical protein|nr:peptidase [Culturomica sp.]
MKRIIIVILLLLQMFVKADVLNKLKQIEAISGVEKIDVQPFTESYLFWFEQPVDHNNLSGPKFKQKVVISHRSYEAPIVVELAGYNLKNYNETELSALLKSNQIKIEHRFFDKSVPETGIEWQYLTIKQSAADHHAIIEALKSALYPQSKWISTGISKGGQTTIFHRYFYPEDVDVSVPYVAPFNLDRVDPRIEKFLNKLGTSKGSLGSFMLGKSENKSQCHYDVRDFQLLCFKRKAELLPLLEEYTKGKGYTFKKVGSTERAFELMVLEYQFAFWQWGTECGSIPAGEDVEATDIFKHLLSVSGPDFFEDKEIERMYPFMYAAYTETGMYDYKTAPFKKYLPDNKKNITFDFALPEGVYVPAFNKLQAEAIIAWMQTDAENILFIYGGQDPWAATAVELKDNIRCRKYIKPDMSHRCRINSFEAITREDIKITLTDWLK